MTTSLETLRAVADRMSNECPQALALGMVTVALEADVALLKLPYSLDIVGDPDTGVIAGGVVTTLLDHASGQAVMAALGEPRPIATLDLRIDYMRAAEPGLDVHARAHCYRITRSVAFVRATAYDRDPDDPVATAQAAFMINTAGLPPPVDPVVDEARP
ncbi:MAG TPA: PaaI family thioesterase [Caulobacteraceae bacterium]|jgi:uncharacterized protein (TIGR00369 family)